MYVVGRIDKEIYKCVCDNITDDTVIITDEQIAHIKAEHGEDYIKYSKYFAEILENPDYIIRANKPNTAVILKEINNNGCKTQMVLRLITTEEHTEYKNSIITFMKIDNKRWNRYLRTKEILYKSK